MSAALRQGMRSRRQEYWLSARKRLLLKVFLMTAESYFLWLLDIQEVFAFLVNNSLFLYSICEPVLVFLQTSFFALSRGSSVCPETAPRCCCIAQRRLPWPFLLCAVVFNKSLKPSASIGPSLVLCLIHCRSPTPSAILLRLTELRDLLQFGDPFSSRHPEFLHSVDFV